MYALSDTIKDAIENCVVYGSGDISLDNLSVVTEWENWDECSDFDVVTVYIYENGVIKIRYQEQETKVRL